MGYLSDEDMQIRAQALIRERAGAVKRGNTDKVRRIDDQLKRLHGQGAAPAKQHTAGGGDSPVVKRADRAAQKREPASKALKKPAAKKPEAEKRADE